MGKIVGDTACPSCREQGRDSTSNHLMLFEDGGGYCNRCGYTKPAVHREEQYINSEQSGKVNMTLDDTDKAREQSLLAQVQQLPVGPLKARGIDKDICERYGVRVEYDTATGEDKVYYYPITINGRVASYRLRELPKTFSNVGESLKGRQPELIGQHTCQKGGKKLLICEGQDDMLAACQMLWRRYPNFPPNVVSLPNGANTKAVADNLDFVLSYEEVLICTDNDEPGQKVSNELAQLVGEKAKIVKLPDGCKDANDALLHGKSAEFIHAFFSAKQYAPEGFVTVDDVWDKATAMPEWGKPWPWPSLTKLTYGRRLGEGMYLGAGVKMGKSEFVNQFVHHLIQNDEKVALFKLEEKPEMTVRKVAGKLKHKQFHIPDGPFTQEELIEGVRAVKDADIMMYGKYGTNRWEDIEPAIRYAVNQGATNVIIDPLTRLVSADPSEANKQLIEISDKISKMSKDLGFFYLICTHLNAPQSGKPHEEGGKVHSNQFTGSRAMMRAAYYMLGIERDKTLEDEVERNTSHFVLLEDRAFGNNGRFPVFYDRETGDYLEPALEIRGDY